MRTKDERRHPPYLHGYARLIMFSFYSRLSRVFYWNALFISLFNDEVTQNTHDVMTLSLYVVHPQYQTFSNTIARRVAEQSREYAIVRLIPIQQKKKKKLVNKYMELRWYCVSKTSSTL